MSFLLGFVKHYMCIIMTATKSFHRLSFWLNFYIMCVVYSCLFISCYITTLGCEDCGNQMFSKYHPGVYGLTAKSHWSCCGSARETGGCSLCHQPSSTDEQDSPQPKTSSKSKPPDKTPTTTSVISAETSTPEPQVMYINPLVEPHLTTTDTTKVQCMQFAHVNKRYICK